MTIRTLMMCDEKGCESELITEDGEFAKDLIERAHAAGWSTTISRDGRANTCPGCVAQQA